MSLTIVTTGNTVLASDVNQMVFVLQRAASSTEGGAYMLSQGVHTSGGFATIWIWSLSRISTPSSASIDTSLQSASNCNAPATGHLRVDGFQISTTSTGTTTNAQVGGLTTIQF